MSFPRYPSYKDSGVEWLGEVPEHWGIARLGFECETIVPMRDKPEHLGGEIPWIRIEDFNGKFISHSKSDQGVSPESVSAMNLKVLPVGTVLCSCSCSMGATAIVTRPLVTNQTFIGIVPSKTFLSDYLYFFFQTATDHLNSIGTGAIQSYLSRDDFRRLRLPCPSFVKQTQIAAFLDRETAKIDVLVAEQRRLMALLKEKRQAVISHAVTQGLNPHAPMKPSGNKWLSTVPAHWIVCCLKHIKAEVKNAFVDGPFGSNLKSEHFIDDGDVYVIESNFATQGRIDTESLKTISNEHFATINRSETRGGDIIIAKIGAQYGKASILPTLDKPAVVSGNSLKLTINQKSCDVKFVNWHLANLKELGVMEDIVNATAQPALSLGEMNNLPMLVSPRVEQEAIVEFLNEKLGEFDTLTAEAQRAIDLLQERRTALISAAVTGQIDVRCVCA
jgi:type I restriction enzyme, S subunit